MSFCVIFLLFFTLKCMNIFYFFTLNDTNISSCAFSPYPPWPMAVTKKENGSPPIRPCVLLPRPFTVMLIFFIEFLMKCMLIILLSLVRNHRNYIPLFWNLREIMLWKSVFWRMPGSFQNQVKHMLLRKLAELYDMAFVFLSVLRPFICSCKKIHGPSLSNSCMKIHESFALVFIEIFSRYILFTFLLFFHRIHMILCCFPSMRSFRSPDPSQPPLHHPI